MPRVTLKGLNVRRNSTGKWYVSVRKTGTTLVSGFEGSRDDLERKMAQPEFLNAYTIGLARKKRTYPDGTLGATIEWYEARDAWKRLKPRTQADYNKVKAFLEPVFGYSLLEITGEDVLEMRDRAAAGHYAKFSNDVIAYMSAVFREAKDARRMPTNPALGISRLYKASKDANRRWRDEEWKTVFEMAPAHLRAPLAIARWAGLRGQDIAVLSWENYRTDPEMGRVLSFVPRKNGDQVGELTIGVSGKLRALLGRLKAGSGTVQPAANSPICRNSLGKKYPSENALRKAWQDYKASDDFKAALPNSSDLTLHGLRVTYASELREAGFSNREIADALGDLSESMGQRYSRGAEMRKTSLRIFKRMAKQ